MAEGGVSNRGNGLVGSEVSGGQDVRIVSLLGQVPGQTEHVVLHASRAVEGVGADESDPQASPRSPAHGVPARRKNGCIMCQSSGCRAI